MGSLQTWRKAYGALKDSTKVGLAKVNSDFKEVDVAIVKATNHVECPPKERHLRKILHATSTLRPRADVAYCIHALARRLAKTHNWTVALKTLIVIHRLLRDGDPSFREELVNFSQKAHILQLSNFKDDSSPIAWDCSAWVRTYALYLEERLECFRILKYDVEAERLTRPGQGHEKGHSRIRDVGDEELLEQLPALQQLLYRLVGCRPEGAAVGNYVIQYALSLVLKESFKIYCAINDGIINLVDKFFEMPRHEAMKALEIYKRAGQQADSLSEFYDLCRGLELARNFQYPTLRQPPQTFLATMEEYVREAPRVVSVPREQLEFQERLLLTYKPDVDSSPRDNKEESAEEPHPEPQPQPQEAPPSSNGNVATPDFDSNNVDLLGLNVGISADASTIEESNALALAIVPAGNSSHDAAGLQTNAHDPTGWELALVTSTTAGNSSSTTVESKLAGGFDKLTLDSLYEEATYRQQQPTYGVATVASNPFQSHDPFSSSAGIAPPSGVQMAAMAQQQHMMALPPPNPFLYFNQQQQQVGANPFGDATFGPFPNNSAQHHQNNPFANTGLL
ncbi:putative clathrin assembly protein At2g01600 [Nymphaea colorata]|nr:putative clathrin assembly protein At2g01600 [Nymphaea colorata]